MTGWMATTIIVPVVLGAIGLMIAAYWYRPRLSIGIAKAVVGSQRIVRTDGVSEYRVVVDLFTPCVAWLAEFSAQNERFMPLPTKPAVPRLVYGVYLENEGRSELTDIRLIFRSRLGEFEVTGSPQLSLTQAQGLDPEGAILRTITVASIPPHGKGVVIGTLSIDDGYLRVTHGTSDQYRVDYELGVNDHAVSHNGHVQFAGAAQMSDASRYETSVNALFTRQKEVFRLEAVHLPLDPIVIAAEGGSGAMRIIRTPFMGCPTSAPAGSYSVSITQLGAQNAEPVVEETLKRATQ